MTDQTPSRRTPGGPKPAAVAPLLLALAVLAGGWLSQAALADPERTDAPPAILPHGAATEIAPLEPASSGGLRSLDRALARLGTHQRLLVIAAHPDDEDTSLLTWVARGLRGEAAYLSLSRGDGGQNLIGPELGVGLGLLRSRELLAARQIDGARQYFTRAFDFGYTRSLDETLERWPKEVLLTDAVRVIRRFKPQIVVAIFPPDARAGHGQHQASAVVAEEAIALAGDPGAFPELAAEGLGPWQPEVFYRAAWWDPDAATLETPLGQLEPFTGRSILQLALASRSQHRCQDMGLIQPLGDATGRLTWVSGGGEAAHSQLFGGVDTSLRSLAHLLPAGELAGAVGEELALVAATAAAARTELTAAAPRSVVPPLGEIVRRLRAIDERLAGVAEEGAEGSGVRHLRQLLGEKLTIAQEAYANAAQVLADAVTDSEVLVPGERFTVRSIFWNAGDLPLADLEVTVASPDGWRFAGRAPAPAEESRFATQVSDEQLIEVEVPTDAGPTVPYFLRRPLDGDLYDWSAAPSAVRGEPFGPPPLLLRFAFTLDGVPVVIEREVVHRHRDQAYGEVRRPLRAAPELEVAVDRDLVVWSIGAAEEERVRVEVRSNADRPIAARLEVEVPEGWPEVAPIEVAIAEPHGLAEVEVVLAAPAALAPGRYPVSLTAVWDADDGERRSAQAIELIDYPHIRATPMPVPARVEVSAGDIRLPAVERVGYVRGASDRVPEFLRAVGVPLELLSARDLTHLDFTPFDAIVIGSRAYEVEPALAAANPRLLDYVRRGGTLIVQYQQYPFTSGGFPPFPLDINRPHDRVTDETAPVRLLAPEHPALRVPNRLTAGDWEGWVQERGLYFAGTWDEAYEPLLAMADPADEEVRGEETRGALLVARLGEGRYVYTGLAFFRQLPAGVIGAYRLFANLLALGNEGESR